MLKHILIVIMVIISVVFYLLKFVYYPEFAIKDKLYLLKLDISAFLLNMQYTKDEEELIEKNQQIYLQKIQAYEQYLDNLYKSDPYGGKTPRETLDLFMQALENKDYKLASKYFVAEKQKEMEKILKDWIEGKLPNYNEYLKTYNTGTIEEYVNPQMQIAQIEIRTKNDETPYWILLIPNPHTGLWKIKKF